MFPYGVAGLPPRRKLEAQMYATGDPPAGDVQVTNLVTSVARGFFCASVFQSKTAIHSCSFLFLLAFFTKNSSFSLFTFVTLRCIMCKINK